MTKRKPQAQPWPYPSICPACQGAVSIWTVGVGDFAVTYSPCCRIGPDTLAHWDEYDEAERARRLAEDRARIQAYWDTMEQEADMFHDMVEVYQEPLARLRALGAGRGKLLGQ